MLPAVQGYFEKGLRAEAARQQAQAEGKTGTGTHPPPTIRARALSANFTSLSLSPGAARRRPSPGKLSKKEQQAQALESGLFLKELKSIGLDVKTMVRVGEPLAAELRRGTERGSRGLQHRPKIVFSVHSHHHEQRLSLSFSPSLSQPPPHMLM